MNDILQRILGLMIELRSEWDIGSLEDFVINEMIDYNTLATIRIDEVQAADLYFFEGEYLYELIVKYEYLYSQESIGELLPLDDFLKEAENLFRKSVIEFRVLWDHPKSSILSYLPNVSNYLPKLEAPSFNKLLSLIIRNAKSKVSGGFRAQSILWAICDYIIYALIGKRGKGRFVTGTYLDAATKWMIDDLRNQSVPESDNYYGFAILRNITAPKNILKMDENTYIRKSSKFEWRELLLPSKKSHIKERMLVNEVNFLHLNDVHSLCILETTLPDSSRSAFRKSWTIESMKVSSELGEKLRSILYDVVSCMRLVIHPMIGIVVLNHTGVHPDTSPLSPIFRPEYHPPPDTLSGISGTIAGRGFHYLTFKMRSDENQALVEFWERFNTFRHESNKTDFHKSYDRALTRFNQACTEYYIEDAIIDLVIGMEIITQGGGQIASYRVAGFVSPDKKIQIVQKIVRGCIKKRNDFVHGSASSEKDVKEVLHVLSQAQLISRAFLRNIVFYCTTNGTPTGKHGFRDILDIYIVDCDERKYLQSIVPDWSVRDISEFEKMK